MPISRLFRRVVVGYNATFAAHAALRLALDMTETAHAQLTIVAVAREPLGTNNAPLPYTSPIELDHQLCRSWLNAAATYAAEASRCADTQLWTGPVHKALATAADAEQADLLIIGSPSPRPWRHPRTVALVTRHSPCPVLAVPR